MRSALESAAMNVTARWACTAGVALLAILLGSCGSPPGPLFAESHPDLAWPPPPEAPRVRWVGQLSTLEDLKPGRGALAGLGEFLFGKDEPRGLVGPRAVVRTPDGRRLWVADPGNHCLHLLDLESRELLTVSRFGERALPSPIGLCLGPGSSLFVCDSATAAILQLETEEGKLLRALTLPPELQRPVAMAWHAAREELFVVDATAHDLKVLRQDGSLVRVLGRRGTAPGQFNYPCDVALRGDRLWVADAGNQRVQAIDLDGQQAATIGHAGDAPGDLALPKGVALDSAGHLYVVDARFENVQVFDQQGRLLLAFGEEGTGPAQFWLPGDVFIDGDDRIWICDAYNRRIQVFDYVAEVRAPDSRPEERKQP